MGFLELVEDQWANRINASARADLHKAKSNRPLLLPLVEDVINLNKYIQSVADELVKLRDPKKLVELLTCVLAEMVAFNRRRCGETQYLKEEEYMTSLLFAKPMDKDIEGALSKFEIKLAKSVHRIEVRGKRGKKVPILLTKSMKSHLDLVVELRKQLHVESPYIFALQSHTLPLRGNDALKTMANACGAKKPELLTSTNVRKQLGTLMQALNLLEDEQDIIASFMGHDIRVHRQFYRLTEDMLQAEKVTKVIQAINTGNLSSAPKEVNIMEKGKYQTFL